MVEIVKSIAFKSMATILSDRTYTIENSSKFVDLIADDVLEKLRQWSSLYSYYLTIFLFQNQAIYSIGYTSVILDTEYEFSFGNNSMLFPSGEMIILEKYYNNEWQCFCRIFAFPNKNRLANFTQTSFNPISPQIDILVKRSFEKYLLGKEKYDKESALLSQDYILEDIKSSIKSFMSNFSFEISLYLKKKGSGGSVSTSKGWCEVDQDGSTVASWENEAYYACAHVVGFAIKE